MKKQILVVLSVVLVIAIAGVTTLAVAGANNRVVTVDTANVITEDFLGVGSNLWAGTLTDYERNTFDSNEANFALSERRIETIEPAMMRMLVLPNWFVKTTLEDPTGEQNWKAGNYNFETSEIYTLCKYCETFKKTGTEVQINFGGQIGEPMISWFAITDVLDMPKSAPADLESFAKAASALLQYLWGKGYDNVKSLSFYNETDLNNWQNFGDQREYWVSMLKLVDAQLKKDGIRNKVKIIGSELSCDSYFQPNVKDWLKYIHDNASGVYDELSVHIYMDDGNKEDPIAFTNTNNVGKFIESLKEEIGDDKLRITEFTWNDRMNGNKGDTSFSESQASQVITFANSGATAAANWFFCATSIPQPVGATMSGSATLLWERPNSVEAVYGSYNEMGLLMRYVPKNSKVVKVTTNDDDIAACAFVKGDDITVLVETDESSSETRDLSIKFDKNLNKTFNRFVYEYPSNEGFKQIRLNDGGNAILNTCDGTVAVPEKELTDTLNNKHRLIVYTTMKEEVQVKVNGSVGKTVASGSSLSLTVDEVYGAANKNVTWSIYSYIKPDGTPVYVTDATPEQDKTAGGSVSGDGTYSAAGVPANTKVAVKATSVADPTSYQIVYITVS